MKILFLILFTALMLDPFSITYAETTDVEYPYPVSYLDITIESVPVRIAYMDVKPAAANGRTVMLLHGKNFNGYYWKDVITSLSDSGFRVVVPDQAGWGKSGYPDIHYSFHLMSWTMKKLLDTLGVDKTDIIAHSMGGMLGTRFTLIYPATVNKLILENPIGLEDYKTFVPYRTIDQQFKNEAATNYESYKKYQQTYYPLWKPEYEQFVQAQADALSNPDFERIAFVNAVTYQMIYEQPVVHEFKDLKVPVCFLIGVEDRTIVGKGLLTKEMQESRGRVAELARELTIKIPVAEIIEFTGVGHIPHIQEFGLFMNAVYYALKK